ncbi:GNAT family N-acetyltransferase [Albidovulum sp.]|uniref:GNAT family N-acetyltransferase n=1 Tax=Albidovulum sp. TaxID=1872424 RepID=UPI001D43A7A8|nr:GNAT family N-acetyltransferase [Paracoccaceae bacterium]MCC0046808.1 GNAT family N-acetyltransferase [Defluviimonas sp.]HPE25466.1 GNAT family N-acetyltransferase [Albidovulum sp.]MCB2144007.1 GNAT family N-acetyltransferase [Paracoccaceae bacterium]MCB2150359.1 GNAT family N-acetyltransferase [Paracoccaceae bacterium]
MTAALTLAGPEDLDRLLPLVAAYHAFEGIVTDDAFRRAALAPLLAGTDLGAVWLIGPRDAPLGYIATGLGWSIELGGPDAFVDELFVVPEARGRGLGRDALVHLGQVLKARGVVALHLEVARENRDAQRFYAREGFEARDRYFLMTRTL